MACVKQLATPVVLVDEQILNKNIKSMQKRADEQGYKLRPHIKSHKSIEIARRQISEGAIGVTAATVEEAYVMADGGIKDILIAFPIISSAKLNMALNLIPKVRLTLMVDSIPGVELLAQVSEILKIDVPLVVKIDSGLGRCGVRDEEQLIRIVKNIVENKHLQFQGLLTHAGHSYGAKDMEELQNISTHEKRVLIDQKKKLEKMGTIVKATSVGATPTVKVGKKIEGITEIRPGNYVFNDANQISLGVAKDYECSLTVLATVVSAPEPGLYIIDAGSKTLSSDRGAHGSINTEGYGIVKGKPDLQIEKLSEEHGFVVNSNHHKNGTRLEIGEVIEIIPNHACTVVNLCEQIYSHSAGKVTGIIKVDARGMVK